MEPNHFGPIDVTGLSHHSAYIVTLPNPTYAQIIKLNKVSLLRTLENNGVRGKQRWVKNKLAEHLLNYLHARQAAQMEQAAVAHPPQVQHPLQNAVGLLGGGADGHLLAAGAAAAAQGGLQNGLGAGQFVVPPLVPFCMIYKDAVSEYIFAMCGHVGLCLGCKNSLVQYTAVLDEEDQEDTVTCPLCRVIHFEEDIKKMFLVI